jgi:hypothetical protein
MHSHHAETPETARRHEPGARPIRPATGSPALRHPRDPAGVLRLQRLAGNSAAASLVQGHAVVQRDAATLPEAELAMVRGLRAKSFPDLHDKALDSIRAATTAANGIHETTTGPLRKNYDLAYDGFSRTLARADQQAAERQALFEAILDSVLLALPHFRATKAVGEALDLVNGLIGQSKGHISRLQGFGLAPSSVVTQVNQTLEPGKLFAQDFAPKPGAVGAKPASKAEAALKGMEMVNSCREQILRLPGGLGLLHDTALQATDLKGKMDLLLATKTVHESWTPKRIAEAVALLEILQQNGNKIQTYIDDVKNKMQALHTEIQSRVPTETEMERDMWLEWMASLPDEYNMLSSGVLDNNVIEARLGHLGILGRDSLLGVDFGDWTSDTDVIKAKSAAKWDRRLKAVVGSTGFALTDLTPFGSASFPGFEFGVQAWSMYGRVPANTTLRAERVGGRGDRYLVVSAQQPIDLTELLQGDQRRFEQDQEFDALAGNR